MKNNKINKLTIFSYMSCYKTFDIIKNNSLIFEKKGKQNLKWENKSKKINIIVKKM